MRRSSFLLSVDDKNEMLLFPMMQGKQWLFALFFMISFFISYSIRAQTTGDYRSNAASFNWSATASWQRWSGAAWVSNPAQGYPGQNTGTGTVTIQNGATVALDVSPANNIGALTVGGGTSGTLNVTGNQNLTATGKMTINSGATFTFSGTGDLSIGGTTQVTGTFIDNETTGTDTFTGLITVSGTWDTSVTTQEIRMYCVAGITNTGSFTAGGIQLGPSAVVTANANMTVSSGLDSDDDATIAGSATVSLTGDRSNFGNVSTGDLTITGTVDVTSTNGGVVLDTSGNLILNGSLTMNTNSTGITINGTTTIGGTFTDSYNASGVDTFVGLVTLNSGGSFVTTAVTTAGNLIFRGGITHNGASFTANIATFDTNAQTIAGSGTLNFSGIVAVTGIVVTNNGIVTMSNTGAGILSGTGTFTQGSGTLNYAGSTITVNTFNASGTGNTVNYNAAGAQTIKTPSSQYHHLTISGSGTKTIGAALDMNGNVSIQGTAVFSVNNLNITVGGNWTNSSTNADPFIEGTGTVTFDGNSNTNAQTIAVTGSGTANGVAFNSLTLNNTFATSPQLTIGTGVTTSVVVSGTLTITRGNINLNSNDFQLGISTATVGTLTYVVNTSGWMYGGTFTRWFAASTFMLGNLAGLFPMGNSTNFRPFYIAPGTAPTAGGTMRLAYNNATTTSVLLPTVNDGGTPIQIRHNANWVVSNITFTGGGTNYSLYAGGTGFTIGSVNDLRLMLFNSVVGSAGANVNAPPPVANRTGLSVATLGNTFYLGSVNAVNTPLPVDLLSYKASPENNTVILSWMTEHEENNDYFTVERAAGVSEFVPIGKVPGSENSKTKNAYQLIDESPSSGTLYYRLSQTDFDGTTEYLGIISVDFNPVSDNNTSFRLYPNPSKGEFYIDFSNIEDGNATVSVLDQTGKLVYALTSSGASMHFNQPLSPGLYFLKIGYTGREQFQKLIIE